MHGVFKLAKSGRKRKMGRRTPTGRLAIVRKHVDYQSMVGEQPHRSWLPADVRLSEKAGTPLGGLNLLGIITDEQHEAGQRYAVIVGTYRSIIGAPQALAGGGRGMGCDPEACMNSEEAREECSCRRTKVSYDAAYEALILVGQPAAKAVNRVAIYAEACTGAALPYLRCGLDALSAHFGLTGRRKSPYRRNTN